MNGTRVALWAVGALLLFWIVGAYNRMVRLRGDLMRAFVPLDGRLRERHELLERQIGVLDGVLANAGPRLETLRSACLQSDAARAHAKVRPGAPGAIASLRVADNVLADARARLPVQTGAGTELSELNARVAEIDAAVTAARRDFNDAVERYNRAIAEFPTLLVAAVVGFRSAGTL